MSLFSGKGLLISIPASEVERVGWRGSLADLHEILSAPLSPELRLALSIVRAAAMQNGTRLRGIARPEMFSTPIAVQWLQINAPGCRQHLCFSDGVSIKTLQGAENHVFFYGPSLSIHRASAAQLMTRAPESLVRISSQVNTYFRTGGLQHQYGPGTCLIWNDGVHLTDRSQLWPFFANLHSIEDTVARINQRGPLVQTSLLPQCHSVHYIPLTSAALDDAAFTFFLAHVVQQAYFETNSLLVLRLPVSQSGDSSLLAGIAGLLTALRGSAVVIPRAVTQNILLMTSDIDSLNTLLQVPNLRLTVHESFDFWRHPRSFYEAPWETTVFSPCKTNSQYTPENVISIYGSRARLQRIPVSADDVSRFRKSAL